MTCTQNEYDLLPRRIGYAVKAIIIREDKIGLIYIAKWDVYDLPGGGIEDGETPAQALIREVKEEAGATAIPSSIKEFDHGKYVLIYKDKFADIVYERHFTCYLCDIEDSYITPQLTEHEIETEQQFMFVSIDDAISANEAQMHQGHWAENPTHVMKVLRTLTEGDGGHI